MAILKNSSGLPLRDSQNRFLYQGAPAKLATPQNVGVAGTVASWDAVEHADHYNILLDGSIIGVFIPTVAEQTGSAVTITNAPAEQNGSEVTLQ